MGGKQPRQWVKTSRTQRGVPEPPPPRQHLRGACGSAESQAIETRGIGVCVSRRSQGIPAHRAAREAPHGNFWNQEREGKSWSPRRGQGWEGGRPAFERAKGSNRRAHRSAASRAGPGTRGPWAPVAPGPPLQGWALQVGRSRSARWHLHPGTSKASRPLVGGFESHSTSW